MYVTRLDNKNLIPVTLFCNPAYTIDYCHISDIFLIYFNGRQLCTMLYYIISDYPISFSKTKHTFLHYCIAQAIIHYYKHHDFNIYTSNQGTVVGGKTIIWISLWWHNKNVKICKFTICLLIRSPILIPTDPYTNTLSRKHIWPRASIEKGGKWQKFIAGDIEGGVNELKRNASP